MPYETERAAERRPLLSRKVTLRGKPLNAGNESATEIARRLKRKKKPLTTTDREAWLLEKEAEIAKRRG